ncbi:MAG: undecaprenyl-diphosphatase [Parcubacteria group bacterium Gr01-1014_48]|nr:MAG: undecaprenyl-diphosphatase [Parcubacteria group bacterium Gr01-1014_48]
MTILDSIILGIIEGVTEFLPISSTGHLILAGRILEIPPTEFLKTFEIAIQLGAITAVLVLYFRSFTKLETFKKIFVAFLPTSIIGLLLYTVAKTYLLGNSTITLIALGIGGLVLIGFELAHKRKPAALETAEITYRQAALIGVFQALAIIPGVSRSAATIICGLFLGISRQTIVEFSFLLAVPTIAAATGLDIFKNYELFSTENMLHLGIGFFVSLIVALASIRFLLRFIRNNTFIPFGIYRIILAILFFIIIF